MASICSGKLSGCGHRMFEKCNHPVGSSESVRRRSAFAHRTASVVPTGKSFRNNAIALTALCHMSDIVENPTTNAPRIHRIKLRESVTPCRTQAVKLRMNLVGPPHLRSGTLHAHGLRRRTPLRELAGLRA